MYSKFEQCFHKPDLGLFIIRLGIAIIFGYAGIMKLANVSMVAGFFGSIGLPVFMVYVIGILEVLGAISMLLGYMTKVSGFILSVILVFAIALVKGKMGFVQSELDIITLAATLGIALSTPGAWSLKCGKSCDNCDVCVNGVCTKHEDK